MYIYIKIVRHEGNTVYRALSFLSPSLDTPRIDTGRAFASAHLPFLHLLILLREPPPPSSLSLHCCSIIIGGQRYTG